MTTSPPRPSPRSTVRTGAVPFIGGETWYRVSEPVDGGGVPLVAVHGGPGAPHQYLLRLCELFDDRPVVLYDQVGSGNSTHWPGWPPTAWTVELFVQQLAELFDHLDLGASGAHLLGHSWGGTVVTEYALRHGENLRSLILTDTQAASPLVLESILPLRAAVTAELVAERGEPASDDDAANLAAAIEALFFARHMCRLTPPPAELTQSMQLMFADMSSHHGIVGDGDDDEHAGTAADWSVIDRLPELRIPALVLAGEFDELGPVAWQPFVDGLPDVRSHVFAGTSHLPFHESPDEYREVVGEFMREHDAPR